MFTGQWLSKAHDVPYRRLAKPQKITTKRPYGPSKEPKEWNRAAAAVQQLQQTISEPAAAEQTNIQALNAAFDVFALDLEESIAQQTDTPLRSRGQICQSPRIVWVSARGEE